MLNSPVGQKGTLRHRAIGDRCGGAIKQLLETVVDLLSVWAGAFASKQQSTFLEDSKAKAMLMIMAAFYCYYTFVLNADLRKPNRISVDLAAHCQ